MSFARAHRPRTMRSTIGADTEDNAGEAACFDDDRPSNHIEPVGAVTTELLDEAVFPIQIGLHRLLQDIGALIGATIAMGRIGPWQHAGRADFERAVIATFKHI